MIDKIFPFFSYKNSSNNLYKSLFSQSQIEPQKPQMITSFLLWKFQNKNPQKAKDGEVVTPAKHALFPAFLRFVNYILKLIFAFIIISKKRKNIHYTVTQTTREKKIIKQILSGGKKEKTPGAKPAWMPFFLKFETKTWERDSSKG